MRVTFLPKRPYRWAVRAYPPAYRDAHADELIQTALEMNNGRWSFRQTVGFVVGGFRRSLQTPRRFWGFAALFPMLYGALNFVAIATRYRWPPGEVLVGLKWATVFAVPVLLFLVAERVGERPSRWRNSALTWSIAGMATILVVARFGATISSRVSSASTKRMWPTGPDFNGEREIYEVMARITDPPTVVEIVFREGVVVVIMAILSAAIFRALGKTPLRAAAVVSALVFSVLSLYDLATPWGFTMDYDVFIGDALLGGTLFELLFFMGVAPPSTTAEPTQPRLSLRDFLRVRTVWRGVGAVPASRRRPSLGALQQVRPPSFRRRGRTSVLSKQRPQDQFERR